MFSHHNRAEVGALIPSSRRSICTHITSAIAIDLYSASVLDCESEACLRAHQDTKMDPRNTARPPVDLMSSMQPAQLASVNAQTRVDKDLCIRRPSPSVGFRYLRMRLTAVQWTIVGICRNWHTLFTAKDMCGLVTVKYCSAPTILLYLVTSVGPNCSPSYDDNFLEATIGVLTGLQSSMPTRFSKSDVYLF